ncbi:MAG: FAD-binding oxidoreductase [Flavobacteriales bacterium]
MQYTTLNEGIIKELKNICSDDAVHLDENSRVEYGSDMTEDLNFPPEAVVFPHTPNEVSEILKLCNENNVPVTPIGARTGLSGGALSVHGGIGLSMKNFDKIIEIDEKNLQATVEPGVITQVFQEAVEEKGLYYPPDPSSRGSCFIGGNLAESSGGPRAVKYGVTKDYVLNLEVVLPNGEIINTGANVLKNATGYNFTQLMIGSEGTLGVITKAVMKLIPVPTEDYLMLVPFNSSENACKAVSAIFHEKIIPSALEFLERDAVIRSMEHMGDEPINLKDDTEAILIIEVDGNNKNLMFKECEKIMEVMEAHESGEISFAETDSEKDRLWKVRRVVGEAAKANTIYKEEDTVVPRYELPTLLNGIKEIQKKYGFKSYNYGHAGDGNLHINIVKAGLTEKQWNEEIPKAIREIFNLVKNLKGTLSGEHGVGYVQKPYLDIVYDPIHFELMKGIKKTFDPKGILNPGKIF